MVAWGWLILAFFGGVYVGIGLVALLHEVKIMILIDVPMPTGANDCPCNETEEYWCKVL